MSTPSGGNDVTAFKEMVFFGHFELDWIFFWLQLMTDTAGNPEEERRAEFYNQPWSQEAVSRYFYCKVRGT